MSIKIIPVTSDNREEVNSFINERWHGLEMAVRGRLVDMTKTDGFAAYDGGELVGLVTFVMESGECEIMSLDSVREWQGTGKRLLRAAIRAAEDTCCRRVKLVTTNDNTDAMRFYQKNGFDMTALFVNAVDRARELKPAIPLTGENGIRIRHEI